MLTYQRTRFSDISTDYGIHYQNEMCSIYNWLQLWNACKQSDPACRMYLCKATYNAVVLNLFHCWDPLNATDVVWDPQVKIEKVCAPE